MYLPITYDDSILVLCVLRENAMLLYTGTCSFCTFADIHQKNNNFVLLRSTGKKNNILAFKIVVSPCWDFLFPCFCPLPFDYKHWQYATFLSWLPLHLGHSKLSWAKVQIFREERTILGLVWVVAQCICYCI